jgi:hypothetical protein
VNSGKTNFVNRKGELISEHNAVFNSTKNILKETIVTGGAGMSFANINIVNQIVENGNGILFVDAKGNDIILPIFEGNPSKKTIIARSGINE